MKFGKEFKTHLEETIPEWRDKFLCYKPLKKLLKQISVVEIYNNHDFFLSGIPAVPVPQPNDNDHPTRDGTENLGPPASPNRNRPWIGLEEWFVRILDEELEKFNDFYVDKEEEFVIRLQELKERIERVKEKSSKGGIFSSEIEFSKETLDIRKDFVTIHGEMVLLKNYSSLNFAGLDKILKKYDKRTGALLRMPFRQRALQEPFFTTEPLTGLLQVCEANLELLFPLEAEVIESSPQNQPVTSNPTNTSEVQSLQEDSVDVYRSTLAAMRTLQCLRKASSTYNPLSFSSFFHNQDEDGSGSITAENSLSNSSAALHNEDADQDVVHSHK